LHLHCAKLGRVPLVGGHVERDPIAALHALAVEFGDVEKDVDPPRSARMNLAYNFARHVIAVSIEKLPMLALVSMGCDYGQGFLRGQPLPEERFVSLPRAATRAAAWTALHRKPRGVPLELSELSGRLISVSRRRGA
jgi:hypothetical protein